MNYSILNNELENELFKTFSDESFMEICKGMSKEDIRILCNEVIDKLEETSLSQDELSKYKGKEKSMLELRRFVGKVLQAVIPNGRLLRLTKNDRELLRKNKLIE